MLAELGQRGLKTGNPKRALRGDPEPAAVAGTDLLIHRHREALNQVCSLQDRGAADVLQVKPMLKFFLGTS